MQVSIWAAEDETFSRFLARAGPVSQAAVQAIFELPEPKGCGGIHRLNHAEEGLMDLRSFTASSPGLGERSITLQRYVRQNLWKTQAQIEHSKARINATLAVLSALRRRDQDPTRGGAAGNLGRRSVKHNAAGNAPIRNLKRAA